MTLNSIVIPNTVSEALFKREWQDATKEVMNALEKNNAWEVVDKPKGKNIVECRWLFTVKYKDGGMLERYKTRSVATGYTRTYGIDY